MAEILFPITTAPGFRPGEGAGRLINCYAEKLQSGARATYARKRAPGLVKIATASRVGCRGLHFYNGVLYVALADRLVKVTRSGGVYSVTDLGEIVGTGRVTFARNNKAPVADVLCTTENDTFVVSESSAPSSLGAGALPQALTVDFIDGYFVWAIRDGRFFVSGLNDTTVDALDFAKAESRSGGLYAAIALGEQLLLCGPNAIEVWQNVGNATGSPFSRATVIPRGIASTWAIGGNTEGFSAIVFVADDNGVYLMDGAYTPQRISSPDLDRLIAAVPDKELLEVTVGVTSGHVWATVTGHNFSWTYDLSTGLWHERESYNSTRWRGVCSVKAFDGLWAVGSRETGEIWLLDETAMTEGDDPFAMSVISQPADDFPNRVAVTRADFDILVGQSLVSGDEPIETEPVVMISWSDDGGNTFGKPLSRALGRTAEHTKTVSVNRCGLSSRYGRVWKLDISDPVYASILRGSQDGEQRSR